MGFGNIRKGNWGEDRYGHERSEESVEIAYGVGRVREQELRDRVANSCMSCDRMLTLIDDRIIPPNPVQEKDYFVRRGIVPERSMCKECHNSMNTSGRKREAVKMRATARHGSHSMFAIIH